MAMINEVRNTVLAIINKNNYGYLSPQDFNLYATQAQLDIYEDYFYQYNQWINKENKRQSGTGYADIVKGLIEVIDSFSKEVFLVQANANTFNLPDDYYLINKIFYYPSLLASGTTLTGALANTLDSTGTPFTPPGGFNINQFPFNGSLVINTGATSLAQAYVTAVPTTSQLTLSDSIFLLATGGESYSIYDNTNITEVERVSQNKIFYLTSSTLTAPTKQFPAYVLGGNVITLYPSTILNAGEVKAQYVRYPLAPTWTYNTLLAGGAPLFNQSLSGYQDFELPESDKSGLVAKICQYVGIEIREGDVYRFGQSEDLIASQTQS
jgi:hypothetical protein|tara:strand:- start:8751 stop:9722 length:972 start_codon:yes stop_codon:yes gene_type:complete